MVGHQKQWNFLKNNFESGQISHAYLFTGQQELGKKKLAKEFIKLINCQNLDRKPCGVCFSCQRIEKENYPDFLLMKLKEGESEIQISQIRDALNFLSYKSYYNSFKSVIVDNADLMSQEAQTCFLKTLEEPKGKTVLILVCSDPAMLLPTISSRCQIIKFFPVSSEELKNYIRSQGVPEKKMEAISAISEGRPGRALKFILNPEKLDKEKNNLQELLKIIDSELAEKFQYAKSANLEDSNLQEIFQSLQRYFRYLLFLKTGAGDQKEHGYFPEISANLANYPLLKIKKNLRLLETIIAKTSQTNVNPKLALEILLMEI